MAKKRSYSDDDRAKALAALAANGGNLRQTARDLGVPLSTLECWAKATRHPEASGHADAKKPLLADGFEDFAARVVGLTTDADIQAATLKDRFTAAGIAVDKARLLRGQTTASTETRLSFDPDAFARLTPAEQQRVIAEETGIPLPPP